MKLSYPTVVVHQSRPSIDKDEDIDTGVSDGSGEFSVRAVDAVREGTSTVFRTVEIEATGDYADWDIKSLEYESIEMLRRDYTR